tara:strand:+ start:6859 stop:7722 length:864 start_codon:yes stop_codon:yes gene_type:complete
MTTKIIKVAGSRQLSYCEYGDINGTPILFFHGFPGSRLEAIHMHKPATKLGCRLISIDRPGMGLSDFKQGATIVSWADDIMHFTDKLGIKDFSIIAHSGGTPFAAACAYHLNHRVNHIALVSGIAPPTHPHYTLGMKKEHLIANTLIKYAPWLTGIMMKMTQNLLDKPEKLNQQLLSRLCQVDYEIFMNDETKEQIINATKEAFKQGIKGPAHEMKLLFKPWGFELNNIHCPASIWHGKLDNQAPISHAQIYKSLIPDAQLMLIDNQGHHSLIRNHIEDIIQVAINR